MNRCETCKWFRKPEYPFEFYYSNEVAKRLVPGIDWGECALGETYDGYSEVDEERPRVRPLAQAMDVSRYHARLVVSPEYGCVQWEAQ